MGLRSSICVHSTVETICVSLVFLWGRKEEADIWGNRILLVRADAIAHRFEGMYPAKPALLQESVDNIVLPRCGIQALASV